MKIRSKFGALVGAGLLTFAVAGIALANTDLLAGQVGIKVTDKTGTTDECAGVEVGAGEIFVHFVLTQSAEADGALHAVFSTDTLDVANASKSNGNGPYTLQWDGTITGDANTTLDSAYSTANGDNLVLSHACFGAETQSQPPSEVPSFNDTGEPATDVPSEPNTATIGSDGTSGPSDSSWLLVAAVGVLLASVVVMTPARAKNRR
jgi:hypothetical protein